MLRSSEIRAQIAEKTAQVQAIVELATSENRELTVEEAAAVDKIQGIGDQPGELAALNTQLERAIRLEARVREIASGLGPKLGRPQPEQQLKKIVIPAKAKLFSGKLKAFQGACGERDAYVFGRVLAASLYNHGKSRQWLRDNGIRIKAAVSEDSNERGGIFVPTETTTQIIRLVEEYGVFRRFAKNEPMGSDRRVIPVRTGGMTAYPVAETNTANEGSNTGTKSEPSWVNIELIARKWKTWLRMSDEINEDSLISLADAIALEMALAFAYAEDNAGFNGDGTSTYHGIVGILNAVNAGSIHTALAGNTAFSTLDLDDFRTLKGKLPEYPGIQPRWFISKEGYCDSMERLMLAAGGNAVVDIANGGVPMFLGSPVQITNVLNSTLTAQTSTKLLAYGDLNMGAVFGDRRKMSMSLTDQRYWDEDQIAVKSTERFDINVHSRGTATAAGAVMVLATPGS